VSEGGLLVVVNSGKSEVAEFGELLPRVEVHGTPIEEAERARLRGWGRTRGDGRGRNRHGRRRASQRTRLGRRSGRKETIEDVLRDLERSRGDGGRRRNLIDGGN
jgi:hypothetical protein